MFLNVRLLASLIVLITPMMGCVSAVRQRSEDDRAVLAELLRAIEDDGQCTACLVIGKTEPYRPWIGPTTDESSRFPPDLLASYRERNAESRDVSVEDVPSRFNVIDPAEASRHFENGPRDGWEQLRNVYGDRVALIKMSAPGYSTTGDVAVVTYSYDYAPLGGETNYMLLSRRNGRWVITQKHKLVLS